MAGKPMAQQRTKVYESATAFHYSLRNGNFHEDESVIQVKVMPFLPKQLTVKILYVKML